MAITLVRNDTAPSLFAYFDQADETGARTPIDVSLATVRFKFRAEGSDTLKGTVVCTKLTGRLVLDSDGNVTAIDMAAPYNVAGVGGRVSVDWAADDLDTAGRYVGEYEITFANGRVMTPPTVVKFSVREDF